MPPKVIKEPIKRPRNSSSDSESAKPPTKMAAKGGEMAMTKLLNELKQGQKELKNIFESGLATLKTELLQAMDRGCKFGD